MARPGGPRAAATRPDGTADGPRLAAAHFAYLTLAIPLDRAQFHPHERPSPAERDRLASEAVRIFLAAYAPRRGKDGGA